MDEKNATLTFWKFFKQFPHVKTGCFSLHSNQFFLRCLTYFYGWMCVLYIRISLKNSSQILNCSLCNISLHYGNVTFLTLIFKKKPENGDGRRVNKKGLFECILEKGYYNVSKGLREQKLLKWSIVLKIWPQALVNMYFHYFAPLEPPLEWLFLCANNTETSGIHVFDIFLTQIHFNDETMYYKKCFALWKYWPLS